MSHFLLENNRWRGLNPVPADLEDARPVSRAYEVLGIVGPSRSFSLGNLNKRIIAESFIDWFFWIVVRINRLELCLCTAEVAAGKPRVLKRVLKEFLPVFSNAFECFS
jgi:hypothetical protein